jgi:hypothetical protein
LKGKENPMGMVMGVTAVILGLAAALIGLLLWTALMFPRHTAGARAALETHPARCFIMGVALALLLGIPVVALVQGKHGMAKLAGWSLALPLWSMLAVGWTGMAQMLGERLRSLAPGLTPLAALVGGVMTLEAAALLPVVGWFLFAPLVGVTLIGAGALGTLSVRHTKRLEAAFTTEPRRHGEEEEIEEKAFALSTSAGLRGE